MSTPSNPEEAIVDAALEMPAHERAAYLDKLCGNDGQLRQLVDALLHAHKRIVSSEIVPPRELSAAAPDGRAPGVTTLAVSVTPIEKPGDHIGRYKLLQQIGEGGGGIVYMAEQVEPVRRRVALKILKLGMDTRQVIARFEAERQALALMDHPNIAKVHDAGATETGRPYFVMELVRGIKITDYCDQNNLSTEKRLDLFIQVCKAAQHAHQKGVIHRDIKPSNILVTLHDGVPVPKVIDFGIAKATTGQPLTDKTVFTAFEQFIGTPAYMSPEQAEMSGLDIDTRSDIYSLGVLLYELLTSQMPFDPTELAASGFEEMRRIIRTEDPLRPSTRLSNLNAADQTTVAKCRQVDVPKLIQLVRGDLDWIVMKCLEKDRSRRYDTANGLASDIQRYLNNEPIVARPPSNFYRFQKLVRRNKLAFAAAGAVVAALIIGLAISTRMFFNEQAARQSAVAAEQEAKTEAAKSRQVARFLQDMLAGVNPSVSRGRDTTLLREILDKTAERVGRDLTNQPGVEAELLGTLGGTYLSLQDFGKAEALRREALVLRRSLFGETNRIVADSLVALARVLVNRGSSRDLSEAEGLIRQALAVWEHFPGHEDEFQAAAVALLASTLQREGKLTDAEMAHREALAMKRRVLGDEHKDLANTLDNLALVLRDQGKLAEAEDAVRQALIIQKKCLEPDHPDVATSLSYLAGLLTSQGKLPEAETASREALAIRRKVLGNDNPQTANTVFVLVDTLARQGKRSEAMALCDEQLAVARATHGKESPEAAACLRRMATLLQSHAELAQAEALFQEALVIQRKGPHPDNREMEMALAGLAPVLEYQGKLSEAEALWREELALERKLSGNEHPFVANSLCRLAAVLVRQGKLAEAKTLSREALDLRKKLPGTDTESLYNCALLCVVTSDTSGYQAMVEKILARLHNAAPALSTRLLPWVCALAPDATTNYSLLLQHARLAVAGQTNSADLSAKLPTLGGLLYRAQRYPEALEQLTEACQLGQQLGADPAYAPYLLAMTHAQLGQTNAAWQSFRRASDLDSCLQPDLTDTARPVMWNRRLTLNLLRKEAESVLNTLSPQPPPSR